MTSITDIPKDIYIVIFNQYLSNDELIVVAQVCKSWNALTNSPQLLNERLAQYHSGLDSDQLQQAYQTAKQLHQIKISFMRFVFQRMDILSKKINAFREKLLQIPHYLGVMSSPQAYAILLDNEKEGINFLSSSEFLRFDAKDKLFYHCKLYERTADHCQTLKKSLIETDQSNLYTIQDTHGCQLVEKGVIPDSKFLENTTINIPFEPDRIELGLTEKFELGNDENLRQRDWYDRAELFLFQFPLKVYETPHELKVSHKISVSDNSDFIELDDEKWKDASLKKRGQ